MKILAVIPARYDSQRFPGKPLAHLGKQPMIQWVYEATKRCPVFDQVIVATDNEKVFRCVKAFGGQVEMTRPEHPSGTDRVAEVASHHPEAKIVVNVQGDQPFVTGDMLTRLVQPYLDGEMPEMTTLACPMETGAAFADPNRVKVICNQKGEALYFSRGAIPYFRYSGEAPVYQHLGLYAFRYDFLATYTTLAPTPLERCEALEQLRVLEHGYCIRVCHNVAPVLEVNSPEDLTLAQQYLKAL